ncbi:MAG: GNAT family N-acetyltransferase [Gemmatimonadaceae bacterium]|nr:GNAT family N-acetyltransferase [Gemmatimonadaceae bacterium]
MSPVATSPRALTLRVLHGAREIARGDWDALARRGYHRHAWFVAAEACGAQARHVAVFAGTDLVAVLPAYIESETLHGDLHARWYGPAHRVAAALGGSLRPSLAVGAPMSTTSAPLGSDAVLTASVLEEAMQLLEDEAHDERVKAIVWPFIPESETLIRDIARRRGYRESFANSEAVIDVDWSSPEEYLGSRSKNVRRTLRNELAWVHDQGIRISWDTDLDAHAATLDAFYRASYVVRNGRPARLPSQFFAKLAAQQSSGVRVRCAWQGTTLLEMAVALEGGGALDLCLGAQAEQNRNGLLYHHCLCYDPIRAAIAGGLTRIHLGPSALYPKVLRGARLTSNLTLARGMTRASRAAVSVLSKATDVRNRAKQRHLLRALTAGTAAR